MIDHLAWSVLLALASWRIVGFLVQEYGPFHVFDRLRYAVGVRMDERSNCTGQNVIAEIFCCAKCMSVWVSWLVVALLDYTPDPLQYVERVLAVSALTIMINRVIIGPR